jgi:hypothetical protein
VFTEESFARMPRPARGGLRDLLVAVGQELPDDRLELDAPPSLFTSPIFASATSAPVMSLARPS